MTLDTDVYNEISDFILGDCCHICKKHFSILHNHRKDGSPHPNLKSMFEDAFIDEIGSGKYVRLCMSCHRYIHNDSELKNQKWKNFDHRLDKEIWPIIEEFRSLLVF